MDISSMRGLCFARYHFHIGEVRRLRRKKDKQSELAETILFEFFLGGQ